MSQCDTPFAVYDKTDEVSILVIDGLKFRAEIEAESLLGLLMLKCDVFRGEHHSDSLLLVKEILSPLFIVHRIIFKIIAINARSLSFPAA